MSKILNQDISIGDNLRVLRCRAGFSQEKVAEKLQVMGFYNKQRNNITDGIGQA